MKNSPNSIFPVNLIIGILTVQIPLMFEAIQKLISRYGPLDYRTEPVLFNVTDYYVHEMGSNLQRIFISFEKLIEPENIVEIKFFTSKIEDTFRDEAGNRQINLDPGYIDFHNFILASFKSGGYKIYLRKGVYGDMTLHYSKGNFTSFPWGFPDFKLNIYNEDFLKIRQLYKKKIKVYSQR